MVDKNYTHIAVVVDRSSSMNTMRKPMLDALNSFFKEQVEVTKKREKVLVDYAQFDDKYELIYTDKRIDKVEAVLEPRGMTALRDGIGFTVSRLRDRLNSLPAVHQPHKVLVVIITDGMENASREWSQEDVKNLIKRQEEAGWSFLFLGANIDAVAVGKDFGLDKGSTLTYSGEFVMQTGHSLSAATTAYRGAPLGAKAGFAESDRKV